MRRPVLPDSTAWHEGTKSYLEAAQIQRCRDALLSWPETGIFETPSSLDAKWMEAHSYYHTGAGKGWTAEALRQAVLSAADREALSLSVDEDTLVKRMLLTDGTAEIGEWSHFAAAVSLLKRLWCTFREQDEDTACLALADEMKKTLLNALSSERCIPAREALFRLDAMLNCMLYLYGYVFPEPLLAQFLQNAGKLKGILEYPDLLRYAKASFEYVTAGNSLILVHPALRLTGKCLERIYRTDASGWDVTGEMMLGGMNSLLAGEKPALDCFVATVRNAVRPDCSLQALADDLRYMAKQGASRGEMEQIFSESLCVLPDRNMLSALERLRQETMPWIIFAAEGLN